MRITLLFLIIFITCSCNEDDNSEGLERFSIDDLPQTWELVTISGGLSGEVLDAEELSVSEIYIFKPDGKFSKAFKDDFREGTINGTYELVTNENSENLILTYPPEIDVLSYCSRNGIENMRITANDLSLFNGECTYSDGPGMLYQRTK